MANSETPISRRPLAISPNAPLLDQLERLLATHLGGATLASPASLSISKGSSQPVAPRKPSSGVSRHRQRPRPGRPITRGNRAHGNTCSGDCVAGEQRTGLHSAMPARRGFGFSDPAFDRRTGRRGVRKTRARPAGPGELPARNPPKLSPSCPPRAPAGPPLSPAIWRFNGSESAARRFCWWIWTRLPGISLSCSR